MNRNFVSVIAGGFGTGSGVAAPAGGGAQPAGEVLAVSSAETRMPGHMNVLLADAGLVSSNTVCCACATVIPATGWIANRTSTPFSRSA